MDRLFLRVLAMVLVSLLMTRAAKAQSAIPCAARLVPATEDSILSGCSLGGNDVELSILPNVRRVVISDLVCDRFTVDFSLAFLNNVTIIVRGSRMTGMVLPELTRCTVDIEDTTIEQVDEAQPPLWFDKDVTESVITITRCNFTSSQLLGDAEAITQRSGTFDRSTLNVTDTVISVTTTFAGSSAYGVNIDPEAPGATIAMDNVTFTMAAPATAAVLRFFGTTLADTVVALNDVNAAITSAGTDLWCAVQVNSDARRNVSMVWRGGSFVTEAVVKEVRGGFFRGGTLDDSVVEIHDVSITANASSSLYWFSVSDGVAVQRTMMMLRNSHVLADLTATGRQMRIFTVEGASTVTDSVARLESSTVKSIGSNAVQGISLVTGRGALSTNYTVAVLGCTIRLSSTDIQYIFWRRGSGSGAADNLRESNGVSAIENSDIEIRSTTTGGWGYIMYTETTVSSDATFSVKVSRVLIDAASGAKSYYTEFPCNECNLEFVDRCVVALTSQSGNARIFEFEDGGRNLRLMVEDSVVTAHSDGGANKRVYIMAVEDVQNVTASVVRTSISMSGNNADMAIFTLLSSPSDVRMEVIGSDVTATGGAQALGYFNFDTSAMTGISLFSEDSHFALTSTIAVLISNARATQVLTSIVLDNVTAIATSTTTQFIGMIRAQGPNGNVSISRSTLVYAGTSYGYGVLLAQGPIAFEIHDSEIEVSASVAIGVDFEEYPTMKSTGPSRMTVAGSSFRITSGANYACAVRGISAGANIEDLQLELYSCSINATSLGSAAGIALQASGAAVLLRGNISMTSTSVALRGLGASSMLLNYVEQSTVLADNLACDAVEDTGGTTASGLVVAEHVRRINLTVLNSLWSRNTDRTFRSAAMTIIGSASNSTFTVKNTSLWCDGFGTLVDAALAGSNVFTGNTVNIVSSQLAGIGRKNLGVKHYWGVLIVSPWANSTLEMVNIVMNVTQTGALALVSIEGDVDDQSSIHIDGSVVHGHQGIAFAQAFGAVFIFRKFMGKLRLKGVHANVVGDFRGFKAVEVARNGAANDVTVADSSFTAEAFAGFSSIFYSHGTTLGRIEITNVSCNFTSPLTDMRYDTLIAGVFLKFLSEVATVHVRDVASSFAFTTSRTPIPILRASAVHLVYVEASADISLRSENTSLSVTFQEHVPRIACNVSFMGAISSQNITLNSSGIHLHVLDAPSSNVSVVHLANITGSSISVGDVDIQMDSPGSEAVVLALRDSVENSSVLISDVTGNLRANATAGIIRYGNTGFVTFPGGFSGNRITASNLRLALDAPLAGGIASTNFAAIATATQHFQLESLTIVNNGSSPAPFLDFATDGPLAIDLTLSDVELDGSWEMLTAGIIASTFEPKTRIVLNCSWIKGRRIIPEHFRPPLQPFASFGPESYDTQRLQICRGSMTSSRSVPGTNTATHSTTSSRSLSPSTTGTTSLSNTHSVSSSRSGSRSTLRAIPYCEYAHIELTVAGSHQDDGEPIDYKAAWAEAEQRWQQHASSTPNAGQHPSVRDTQLAAGGVQLRFFLVNDSAAEWVARGIDPAEVSVTCSDECEDTLADALERAPLAVLSADPRVLVVTLPPVPGLELDVPETLHVSIHPDALACARFPAARLTFAVTIDTDGTPETRLAADATQTLAASGVVAAAASPGAFADAQMLATFGLISCASKGNRYAMKKAFFLLSPFALGPEPTGFVWANVVLVAALGSPFALVMAYRMLRHRNQGWARAMYVARFPALYLKLALMLHQGLAVLSMRLLWDGISLGAALLGTAIALSMPAAVIAMMRHSRPRNMLDGGPHLLFFFRYESSVHAGWPSNCATHFLIRNVLPVGRWPCVIHIPFCFPLSLLVVEKAMRRRELMNRGEVEIRF